MVLIFVGLSESDRLLLFNQCLLDLQVVLEVQEEEEVEVGASEEGEEAVVVSEVSVEKIFKY